MAYRHLRDLLGLGLLSPLRSRRPAGASIWMEAGLAARAAWRGWEASRARPVALAAACRMAARSVVAA